MSTRRPQPAQIAAAQPLVPNSWNLPERIRERLGKAAGRQRAMEADEHLLLVLYEPPHPYTGDRHPRLFWRQPDGKWRSTTLGDGAQALDAHLAEFAARLEKIEAREEQATSAAEYFDLLQELVPLARTTRNLLATLQQARELLPRDQQMISLRDQAGELDRMAELLHADVQNGLNFTVAFQAEEQAQRSYEMTVAAHRLNLLAAIFFPIATLSTLFGMNLEHGLETWNAPWAFWLATAAAVLGGLLLSGVIMQRPRPPEPRPKAHASYRSGHQ